MDKSPDAFRTISEVADDLETPAHVLRFWESRFPQIRPVKRAGGRRYYRPADVALLTGIKRLLHDEGLTIRGVQKILREQGVRHVAGLSGEPVPDDIDMDAEAALEAALASNFGMIDDEDMPPEKAESATIHALETALRRPESRIIESAEVVSLQAEPEVTFDFKELVKGDEAPATVEIEAAAAKTEAVEIARVLAVDATDADPIAAKTQLIPDAPYVDAVEEVSTFASVIHTPTAELPEIPTTQLDPMPKESPALPAHYATLIERLQALPIGAFANRQPEAHALRARLVALRRRIRRTPDISQTSH